jgi:hypothetical protein
MRQEERQRRAFACKQEQEALQPQVQQLQPAVIYERKAEETVVVDDKKAEIEEVLEYANNVSEVENNLSKEESLETVVETVYELEEKKELAEVSVLSETSLIDEKTKKKKKT